VRSRFLGFSSSSSCFIVFIITVIVLSVGSVTKILVWVQYRHSYIQFNVNYFILLFFIFELLCAWLRLRFLVYEVQSTMCGHSWTTSV
jgi:hypothetical protein